MNRIIATIMLALVMIPVPAMAVLKVDITQGHRDPLPIALPDLPGATEEDVRIGRDIMRVVQANLERSGLFASVDKRAFIEQVAYGQVLPRFGDWRQINAQALVTGTVTNRDSQNVSIAFRLWDTYAEQQIAGKEFTTLKENWRRVAHLISDEIYKRLTGEEGYFDSRIVYIAESGPADRRVKRLAVMDQDGENHKFLTDGSYLVLTPRFSPSFQEVIYLSYKSDVPRVHIRDLETGREDVLGEFRGMSFAPRFSADGGRVIMSIAEEGNTDIFEMDLRSRHIRQLTDHPAIDTSPSYAPDGRRIVFNSDRGGSQQLYVMDAGGGNVQRISFGDGRYGTPVWSPRGDLVAFTKMHQGEFYIGVMRPDGSGERLLTRGYLVEGPTWSSNGRVIVFTRQERGTRTTNGRSRLFSVDVTGFNEREIITPMDASDPAWSPLLPL